MTSWYLMQRFGVPTMTLTDPPQRPQTSMSILKTRLRRCAQVMPDKTGQALAA